MVEDSLPIVAMLIPSLDDLARQLYITRPAFVGMRSGEYIVYLRECITLHTSGFDGPAGSQVVIVYLNAQVLGRMAFRAWLHGRH
jgi:hypothetical protein